MVIAAAVARQKDLFTKRYRQVRGLDPSELQIHIALIKRCQLQARRDVLYFHIPNGELRDRRHGAKLKAMGVLPGVPDLQFIWNEGERLCVLFLELKARKRSLSPEQFFLGQQITALGCHFEWADSIDQAVAVLQQYRILPDEPSFVGRT